MKNRESAPPLVTVSQGSSGFRQVQVPTSNFGASSSPLLFPRLLPPLFGLTCDPLPPAALQYSKEHASTSQSQGRTFEQLAELLCLTAETKPHLQDLLSSSQRCSSVNASLKGGYSDPEYSSILANFAALYLPGVVAACKASDAIWTPLMLSSQDFYVIRQLNASPYLAKYLRSTGAEDFYQFFIKRLIEHGEDLLTLPESTNSKRDAISATTSTFNFLTVYASYTPSLHSNFDPEDARRLLEILERFGTFANATRTPADKLDAGSWDALKRAVDQCVKFLRTRKVDKAEMLGVSETGLVLSFCWFVADSERRRSTPVDDALSRFSLPIAIHFQVITAQPDKKLTLSPHRLPLPSNPLSPITELDVRRRRLGPISRQMTQPSNPLIFTESTLNTGDNSHENLWALILGFVPCIVFFVAVVPEVVRVWKRDEKESPSLSGRSTFFTKLALAATLLIVHLITLPEEWDNGGTAFIVSVTQACSHLFAIYHQIHVRGHLQTFSHALLAFYFLLTLSDIYPLLDVDESSPFKIVALSAKVVLPFLVFCLELLGPQGWKPHLQRLGYENLPTEEGESEDEEGR
ncbi:hypothetical protein P7C70_g3947, partial [Phenoliferia sp. Uapishka_3]